MLLKIIKIWVGNIRILLTLYMVYGIINYNKILIKIWVPGKLPSQVKREAGENPARSRRCIEEMFQICATELIAELIWEGLKRR